MYSSSNILTLFLLSFFLSSPAEQQTDPSQKQESCWHPGTGLCLDKCSTNADCPGSQECVNMPCYNLDTGKCVGVEGWCQWKCWGASSISDQDAVLLDAKKLGLSPKEGAELAAIPSNSRNRASRAVEMYKSLNVDSKVSHPMLTSLMPDENDEL